MNFVSQNSSRLKIQNFHCITHLPLFLFNKLSRTFFIESPVYLQKRRHSFLVFGFYLVSNIPYILYNSRRSNVVFFVISNLYFSTTICFSYRLLERTGHVICV